MQPLRHVLSAVALAALAVAGLAACSQKIDPSSLQAAAQKPVPAATTAPAPTFDLLPPTTVPAPSSAPSAPKKASSPTTTRKVYPFVPPSPLPTRRPAPAKAPAAAADTTVAGQVLTLVNAERAEAGCKPVTLDARLTKAAAGHSQDMAANDYFEHDSKDGRTFADRIEATGYPSPRSENIAAGQPTPAAVMDAWMNSAGHKRNILDCSATQMGLATAKGGTYGIYWTQDFGTA